MATVAHSAEKNLLTQTGLLMEGDIADNLGNELVNLHCVWYKLCNKPTVTYGRRHHLRASAAL